LFACVCVCVLCLCVMCVCVCAVCKCVCMCVFVCAVWMLRVMMRECLRAYFSCVCVHASVCIVMCGHARTYVKHIVNGQPASPLTTLAKIKTSRRLHHANNDTRTPRTTLDDYRAKGSGEQPEPPPSAPLAPLLQHHGHRRHCQQATIHQRPQTCLLRRTPPPATAPIGPVVTGVVAGVCRRCSSRYKCGLLR